MRVLRTLILLWTLEFRGRIRWLVKQARRPAGAIMIVFWCLMAGSWVIQFLFAFSAPKVAEGFGGFWFLGDAVALTMAGIAILALLFPGEVSMLVFRPVETDVLFAGPFTRRHILLFKLASQACSIAAVALVFSLFTSRILPLWFAGFMTFFLLLHFLRTFPMTFALFLQAVQQRGARIDVRFGLYASRIVAAIIRVGACVIILLAIRGFYLRIGGIIETHALTDPKMAFALIRQDPFITAILWPFQAHGNLAVSARLVPDALYWLLAAGSINLGIVFSIVLLDADFMESEIAAAQRRFARLERLRRGQIFVPKARQWGRVWSIPDFPRLLGAGAIAWRQTTGAMRSFPTTMALLPVLCVAGGIGINATALGESGDVGIAVIVGVALYLTVFFASMLQRNFRGDLDVMESLKAMPAHPTAVVLGESFAPVVQFTYIHLAISLAVVIGFERPFFWFSVLLVALPLNTVLALSQNLGFLLLPARVVHGNAGDIVAAGKQMVSMLIVGAIVLACVAVGLVLGAIAWAVFAHSLWAAQLGAALGLWISVAALVPITASAFKNFDFSADMPG